MPFFRETLCKAMSQIFNACRRVKYCRAAGPKEEHGSLVNMLRLLQEYDQW